VADDEPFEDFNNAVPDTTSSVFLDHSAQATLRVCLIALPVLIIVLLSGWNRYGPRIERFYTQTSKRNRKTF